MNTVSLHVDSVVNALGWTLLHFLWQGAAIAAAYAILSLAFKGCRANVRYNLGVLALFLMLLTPVLTFLSIFQLPVVQTGLGEPLLSFSVQAAGAQSTSWLGGLGLWFDLLTPWAVAGWLAGVALMSRKLFKEWSQVKQLVRHNVKPLPANWQRVADSLHRLFGIRVVVRVLESGNASVPMVLGWLKPVILVPSSAILGLSQQQLEMLLAHEFAHIRRMDYLVNLLQIFVETLLFYHPAIRWLSARVRHERELCCDELVVELKGDSLVYARALAGMEELRSLRPSPSIGMAASGGHLLTRISRLSAAPVPQKGVLHWIVGLAVMTTGLGMFAATHVTLVTVGEPGTPIEVTAPAKVSTVPLPETPVPPTTELTSIAPPLATLRVESADVDRPQEPVNEVPAVPVEPVPQEPDSVPITPTRMGDVDRPAVPAANRAVRPPLPNDGSAGDEQPPAETPASIPEAIAPQSTASPTTEVTSVDDPVITGGWMLSGKQPKFPRKARLRGTEGWVTVRYTIDRDGRVRDARTLESSNGRIFSKTVHRALATWQFEPFRQDGKVVEQTVTRTIQFRIDPDAKIISGCVLATGSRLCKTKRNADIRQDRLYQARAN